MTRNATTNSILAAAVLMGLVTACGSEQQEPFAAEPTPAFTQSQEVSLTFPGRTELADAWARGCPNQAAVGEALCKSKGMADPNFTCDFALASGEDRQHTVELAPAGDRWDLVDPGSACELG